MEAQFLSMLRPELVCLAALGFVQVYAYYYRETTARIFRHACWAAIAHLLFDLVTVITVNTLDSVSPTLNKFAHLALYISAMIFCYIHLDYILAQVVSSRVRKTIKWICRVIIILYTVGTPFTEVTYTESEITNYSGGFACYAVMGTAYAFFVAAIVLLVIRRKRVEFYIFLTTMTTTLFMTLCVTMQLLIPTFLFTGCGITVVTLGMFFAIENPAKYYRQRALVDLSTGVKNKNCYDEDVKSLSARSERLTVLVCDINWLKFTNDTYGHLAGDELIRATANILAKSFKNEYSVYRFGGDEFVVVFIDKDKTELEREVTAVYEKCEEMSKKTAAPLSVALGFAGAGDEGASNITEIISLADMRMYDEKERIKANGFPEAFKNKG